MAEHNGFKLYFDEKRKFINPGLVFLPRQPGILYSTTFITGMIWRGRSTACFEIRATDLRVKNDNGMISFFVKQPDGINRSLFSFVEKFVAGITDLEDKDVIPEAATPGLFGKLDPRRFYISPLQRPI